MAAAHALSDRAVPVPERRRVQPRLEAGVVPPPGHHQPGRAPVGRLEELKALEAVLVVDRARPGGEPAGKLIPALGRHGNGIDLHDGHVPIMPAGPGGRPPDARARRRPQVPPAGPRRPVPWEHVAVPRHRGGPMPAGYLSPRPLGSSGMDVSALSLGSWRTFERLPPETGAAILRAARDEGITFFDDARYNDETSQSPVPTGYSEVLFGELFRGAGLRRDETVVANKLWWELWPGQSAAAEL